MNWSKEQLNAYEMRHLRQAVIGAEPANIGVEIESKLHQQIQTECARRGWLVFHGSMAHRTHRTKGEPDFTIVANPLWNRCSKCDVRFKYFRESKISSCCGVELKPELRWFLIECKKRNEKPSSNQLGIMAHARKLEVTIHVVRSFEQFLEVVK